MRGTITAVTIGWTVDNEEGRQESVMSLSELERHCRPERVGDLLDDLQVLCADVQDARDRARSPGQHDTADPAMTPDEVTRESIECEFPGWEAWLGVDRVWHARLGNNMPPVVVHGEDLGQIKVKLSQMGEGRWRTR
jgi:hypothetical protein